MLASCSREAVEEEKKELIKNDFFVETQSGSAFGWESVLEKTGQVRSSQDIDVTANASGRVSDIRVKTGDTVWVWKTLANLQDTVWSYGINIQRSNNNIERAQINYEAQKINLDKQIFDAGVNIQNLERSLKTLREDSQQNIIQGEDSLKTSRDLWNIEKLELQKEKLELQREKFDIQDDKIDLQLENTQKNIEKSRFDYDLRLKTDEQTIQNYGWSLKIQYTSLETLLNDVVEFGDEIFGVTERNRRANDAFEDYLWAKDTVQKNATIQILIWLIDLQESIDFSTLQQSIDNKTLSEQDIQQAWEEIGNSYSQLREFLSGLEKTLNSSITSVWDFSESQVAGYIANTNGFQSQVQWNFSGFVSFQSWVDSFFTSYQDNQQSILKSIDLQEETIDVLKKDKVSLEADRVSLEKDIASLENDKEILLRNIESGELSAQTNLNRTKIGIDDNIASLETQIAAAKNTLLNAQKNKTVTLKSLQNAIDEARIGLSSSSKEFSKLTVSSPINGTVEEVFVDKGQEISQGTALFRIVSDATPEVEISFSADEKKLVSKWQKVIVEISWKENEGQIYAISDIADENLNYKATVTFKSGTSLLWNLVSVRVPVATNKMLIPLNIITTQWGEIGTVKTLSGSTFADVRVRMWDIFWEYVEIVSCAKNCVDLNIVTSDIGNFDENRFTIIEK